MMRKSKSLLHTDVVMPVTDIALMIKNCGYNTTADKSQPT